MILPTKIVLKSTDLSFDCIRMMSNFIVLQYMMMMVASQTDNNDDDDDDCIVFGWASRCLK